MKAITTHEMTDFDGLAAMVLAKKLFPHHQVLQPQKKGRGVEDFLALYKDEFSFIQEFTGEEKINELVLVDTQKIPSTLLPDITLTIYDHHPPFEVDAGPGGIIKPVGSTTTILLELIKEKGLKLSEAEKVLAAIAIYSDTLSFTADYTGLDDFQAALFLWQEGFNIHILREFLHLPLNQKQQDLLNELLDLALVWKIKGFNIHVFPYQSDQYISGLNQIAQTLMDIRDADAVFLMLGTDDRQFLVGRARVREIDLGPVMERLGGGGHRGAGSALVRDIDGATLQDKLRGYLEQFISSDLLARNIMSRPVKTITPDTTVEKAEEIMEFYGHNGLIIMDEDDVAGIFSRRDLLKVKKHGLSHAPVKGYMSRRVLTITPETTVPEIQEIMIKNNVGRLPVLDEDGALKGIVTRSDLLKVHHQEQLEVSSYGGQMVLPRLQVFDVGDKLGQLPSRLEKIFKELTICSSELEIKVYVVGGFVRDLLLGMINYNLDFIVEEDAVLLARRLTRKLGGNLTQFADFNTATVELEDGLALDFAQTRREYYEYPAALPQVEPASLKQDLYRRDFTVNAMVIGLSGTEWGQLIDIFGGFQDLKARRLQALHTMSFVDDPQRVFRGLSLIMRYNFSFSPDTRSLLEEAVEVDIFRNLPALIIKDHLKRLLQLGDWSRLAFLFDEFRLWPATLTPVPEKLSWEEEALNFLEQIWNRDPKKRLDPLLVFAGYVFREESRGFRASLVENWQLDKKAGRFLVEELEMKDCFQDKLKETENAADVFWLFHSCTREMAALMGAQLGPGPLRGKIEKFLLQSSLVEISVSGQDLLDLGVPRGPILGEILRKIKTARINGEVTTPDEELDLARRIFFNRGGKNSNG